MVCVSCSLVKQLFVLFSHQAVEVAALTPAQVKEEGPLLEIRSTGRRAAWEQTPNQFHGLAYRAREHPVSWAITVTPAPVPVTPAPGTAMLHPSGHTVCPSTATPLSPIATPPSLSLATHPVRTVRGATRPRMALQASLLRTAWHGWLLEPLLTVVLLELRPCAS